MGYENAVYEVTRDYIYPLETPEQEPEQKNNDGLVDKLRQLTLAETDDLAQILSSAYWEYKNN